MLAVELVRLRRARIRTPADEDAKSKEDPCDEPCQPDRHRRLEIADANVIDERAPEVPEHGDEHAANDSDDERVAVSPLWAVQPVRHSDGATCVARKPFLLAAWLHAFIRPSNGLCQSRGSTVQTASKASPARSGGGSTATTRQRDPSCDA